MTVSSSKTALIKDEKGKTDVSSSKTGIFKDEAI